MLVPEDFNTLVDNANTLGLYKKLILQLNKDLRFANIDLEFDVDTLPTSLKIVLKETIYYLIQEKFSDYLNLLYIVDVSEKEIKALDGNDTLKLSDDVTFLVLKRVWKKVWYKSQYI